MELSRQSLAPDREPSARRSAGVGHADALDSWLGGVTPPAGAAEVVAVSQAVDWSAPACPVALAYDTAEQRLPSGVRAVVREGRRHLMFEANAYEVMLRVASDRLTERHELEGQVLFKGLPLPGATVRLDRGATGATTSTDLAGGFRLPPLVRGAYRLQIAVDGAILTVPPIAL
jgi:hypothetical protein